MSDEGRTDEEITRAHAEALQHDIEVLEEKAKEGSRRLALRAAPVLAGVFALLVAAWILGRKTRRD